MTNPDFYVINKTLTITLGSPEDLHRSSPLAWCSSGLEVLLATVLTQATADRNALQAWKAFQKSFPEFEDVLTVDETELATVIRSAGLAEQKARTIKAALIVIKQRLGKLSLDPLQKNPESAMSFLTSLPGIGPKTAACTILFGLRIPSFPVDTHIDRIIKRLGWVPQKTHPATAQEILTREIPPDLHSSLHILLLNLGRNYCRPTKPFCSGCPLNEACQGKTIYSTSS